MSLDQGQTASLPKVGDTYSSLDEFKHACVDYAADEGFQVNAADTAPEATLHIVS
jgi:hypothetical protein